MALVEVSDYVIWTKHIHGDEHLKRYLEQLDPEETVTLRIAGAEGTWRKMRFNEKGGYPVPGLSPVGPSKALWRDLYRRHKPKGGAMVELEIVRHETVERRNATTPWEEADAAEKEAAWEAFKALWQAGWTSTEPYGDRNELHDRDEGDRNHRH